MVRSHVVAIWAATLFSVTTAQIAPQARYINTSSIIAPSTAAAPSSNTLSTSRVQTSWSTSSPSLILSPSVDVTTSGYIASNADPQQSLSISSSSSSSNVSSPILSTAITNATTSHNSTSRLTITSPTPTSPATVEPTTSSSCYKPAWGEAITTYVFVANTTTLYLPVSEINATQTPEFTPPAYCCTQDCETSATTTLLYKSSAAPSATVSKFSSYYIWIPHPTFSSSSIPVYTGNPFTTTVIITVKNPTTVFTSNSVPRFPAVGVDTKKQTVQGSSDSPGVTFPVGPPSSASPHPPGVTTTAAGSAGTGGGSSGGGDNSGGSESSGGSGSSGGSSSGGSSSGGGSTADGSQGDSSGGDSSGGGSSSGSDSGGGSSSGGSSSGADSSGGSSGGSSSGGSSSGGSSSGADSSGGSSGGGSSGNGSGQQAASPTITVTAGDVPITLTPSNVAIDGQTIVVSAGSKVSATTVVANGQTFTINPSQVIAPGTVIDVPTAQVAKFAASPTPTVIGGASISIGGNIVWIGSSSYTFGQGAVETSAVVNGKTISIGAKGIGFASAKTTIEPPSAQLTAVLVLGGDVFSAIGSSIAVIDGQTFTYGPGIPQTTDVFNGETITIASNGIIQTSTTLGGPTHPTGTQIGIAGGLPVTEIGASIIVIATTTFTIGPGATSTTAVINGKSITADASEIEIGTITKLSYPLNPVTSAVTAGGITFSEVGSSIVVIDGTSYTVGPGAKTVTEVYNSQTISIGPDGVGFRTTTIAPPGPTSTKKSGVGKVIVYGRGLSMSMGLCIAFGVGFLLP